jgi:hypothetical protein
MVCDIVVEGKKRGLAFLSSVKENGNFRRNGKSIY